MVGTLACNRSTRVKKLCSNGSSKLPSPNSRKESIDPSPKDRPPNKPSHHETRHPRLRPARRRAHRTAQVDGVSLPDHRALIRDLWRVGGIGLCGAGDLAGAEAHEERSSNKG